MRQHSNAAQAANTPRNHAPALYDSPESYGLISRFNHWLGAALVLLLLGLGLYFEDMPRGPEKIYWLKLHVAIGALAVPLLAFRVLWRLRHLRSGPMEFEQPAALQWLTRIVHGLLLLGMAVLIVSGPLAVWTGGRAIDVFGWFAIPSPMGENQALHEALEVVHGFTAKVILFAVIAHVLGAVKHLLFERERLAGRMFGRPHGRG